MRSHKETQVHSEDDSVETKVQFPLDDLDIANIHEFAALLRNRVNKMNPVEMLTASTLLFALDRLPYVTPGIDVSMTIRRNCLEDFSDWIGYPY